MTRKSMLAIGISSVLLAVLAGTVIAAQDKYSLKSSSGIAFSDFRGYEDCASDQFTADPSPSDCGHTCHVAVKAKDYIFHPYQKR